jgi:cyclohexa-1,5-dienecarbonyl-CoA hydratase
MRPDIAILIVSGSQRAFSAGVDVAAHTPDKVEQMLNKFHGVIRALVGSKKVSIAAVHGICLGGGAELAMVCDLAYTSELATWGFPEIKLGCYPPVAVTALAALVGQKHAADLVLTGRSITGREAASIGLANSVVPEVDLEHVVQDTVHHLSQLSPAALAITKKAIYAWDAIHFDKGLARAEKTYLDDLMRTEDTREGINAFLEKRPPVWKGR